MKRSLQLVIVFVGTMSVIGAACARKKVAVNPPPPPPPPTAASTPKAVPLPTRVFTAPTSTQATRVPRYPNAATRERIDQLLARIEDAYFDYDQASLRPDALRALQADATELREILAQYPDYKLTIQGHCDERGSAEYNLGLGDSRAQAAEDYLVQMGIPSGQLSVISYGKERPVCAEHNEGCWQKNRRVHIVAMAQAGDRSQPFRTPVPHE